MEEDSIRRKFIRLGDEEKSHSPYILPLSTTSYQWSTYSVSGSHRSITSSVNGRTRLLTLGLLLLCVYNLQDFPDDWKEKFGLNILVQRNLETLLFQYAAEK